MVRISEDERSQSTRLVRWRRDHDAISVAAATAAAMTAAVTAEAVATAEEAGNYHFSNQTAPWETAGLFRYASAVPLISTSEKQGNGVYASYYTYVALPFVVRL